MKPKSLKINIILNITRALMSLIFPIITFPYASRILLPEGIGKINYVNSIISYFTILAMLGIDSYGAREVARLRDKKDELNQFCSEVFTLNLISTIVSYILLFLIILSVPSFQSYKTFLIYSSITILFTTIGICWLYGGIEEYAYITFRTVLFQIIS
ncbi:MAG: oligosaccharide flippase family protein, partial [Treponema sp.]|nr:oligosaccharide flippase family protein [Treponema sp.]